jgi:hypothetical protein
MRCISLCTVPRRVLVFKHAFRAPVKLSLTLLRNCNHSLLSVDRFPLQLLFDLLLLQELVLTQIALFVGYLVTINIDRLIGTELGAIPEYRYLEEYLEE